MRRAVWMAILSMTACSGPTNVADEYESTPKFYTVVDPEDPKVLLEDGTQMRVEGAEAGQQIDIGSLMMRKKAKAPAQ